MNMNAKYIHAIHCNTHHCTQLCNLLVLRLFSRAPGPSREGSSAHLRPDYQVLRLRQFEFGDCSRHITLPCISLYLFEYVHITHLSYSSPCCQLNDSTTLAIDIDNSQPTSKGHFYRSASGWPFSGGAFLIGTSDPTLDLCMLVRNARHCELPKVA